MDFKNKTILIVGDVMLDSYMCGNVERISPEAPVPIVDILSTQHKLGGAANVASNIKNLGGTPIICSIIGDDLKGKIFLSELDKLKISTDHIIKSNNRITTNKIRIIGNNHQMLRLDEEIKTDLNFNDQNKLISEILNILSNEKIDCVLLQDYDKGILNNTIISTITTKANNLNIPIVVDPKKKNFSYYNNITLFKPNLKEFIDGLNIPFSGNYNENDLILGSELLHKRGIEIVFVTLSERGMFLSYKKDNKTINKIIPGIIRNVVDVSGAGDTCISIISFLLGDLNIEKIANIANIAGGIVCEEIGVVPINKDKLITEIHNLNII
jgi:rfaE bifunctional protein kinase chain/domain